MAKIPGGYILQPRCIDESSIMHDPPVVRELWFYLLRQVSHKDSAKYSRGQGFFNLGDIQDALCWYVGYRKQKYSKPQLTKSLRRLRERNMIETAKATRGVHVTVLNYDYYQDPGNYEGNDEGNTKETRRKQSGRTKNKNVKNEKNIYSSERSEDHSEQVVVAIPLISKTEDGETQQFCVLQQYADELQESYPGVDIDLALRDIRQWNSDNPTRRKTSGGIRKHISSWISKAQNQGKYKRESTFKKREIEPVEF